MVKALLLGCVVALAACGDEDVGGPALQDGRYILEFSLGDDDPEPDRLLVVVERLGDDYLFTWPLGGPSEFLVARGGWGLWTVRWSDADGKPLPIPECPGYWSTGYFEFLGDRITGTWVERQAEWGRPAPDCKLPFLETFTVAGTLDTEPPCLFIGAREICGPHCSTECYTCWECPPGDRDGDGCWRGGTLQRCEATECMAPLCED